MNNLFCCNYLFDMIDFCECAFEIRASLNSILTMVIYFHQLQVTGTRLRPPRVPKVGALLPITALM